MSEGQRASIKLTTLTPVHVGSGETLFRDLNFVVVEDKIVYLDDRKLIEKIGILNINQWTLAIERGQSVREFLSQMLGRGTHLDWLSLASRTSHLVTRNARSSFLKTLFRTACAGPTIPGSAIKGAFTTLLLNHFLTDDVIRNIKIYDISSRRGEGRVFSSENLMNRFFGKEPNSSINRFLKVFDASFEISQTEVHEVFLIKLKREMNGEWIQQPGQSFLVECIPRDQSAVFSLKLDYDWFSKNRRTNPNVWNNKQVDHLNGIPSFFEILRRNQEIILGEEIEDLRKAGLSNYEWGNTYLSELTRIQDALGKCEKHECIVRVGGHVGWHFITGGWVKHLNEEHVNEEDFNALRRAIQRRDYSHMNFWPKTRKTTRTGVVFGFVKLSILN